MQVTPNENFETKVIVVTGTFANNQSMIELKIILLSKRC